MAGSPKPIDQHDVDAAALASAVRPSLVTYFRRRIGSPESAEEMAHETILRFVEGAYDPLAHEARLILFGIARHILSDELRRRRRESLVALAPFEDDVVASAPSSAPTPDRILEAKHELTAVAALIEAMPPRTRAAFLMSRLHGLKHAEIAARLGVSKSMVEKHIMDATARLLRGARKSLR